MITITKEQLISHARESVSYLENLKGRVSKEGADCKVVLEMVERDLELARIALASLEAEPIGFRCRRNDNLGDWSYVYHREPDDFERKHLVIEGIYATPPAPVVQEEKPIPNPLSMYAVDAVAAIAEVRGWNACRAAMLHSAEPASNHEELPLDYLQGQKDGLEWAAQLAEANHPQTGDWLYDDPLELAKAIRKGPDMPEFDGPTPVTPDGWISCSERMPEETGDIIVVSDGIVMSGISYSRRDGFYIAALEYDDDEPIGGVTHWMLLPEPPQEVK
ncbi:DUF551 domain-containing protein [Escherichia coli]|uniref:DUF551 domain-containing protein n=3 Tax=Escherichia coli TaxID=562 RepID=UPI0009930573|nr:DUF551 domain-containing protein [Escherichia coli]AQV70726.1 hypothetical protein BE930_29695 [Escherichia coli]EJD6322719.1 DUF551 domain-containing protein [Escherichia coli]EJD6339786.1 DUF551 domain-containing protein [Escherichia coli]EJD6345659.1 DUF551 domain-containing protein [Escherichia coli]EJD6552583.1 DUF551 domain-containing protein [Escherichia coli]